MDERAPARSWTIVKSRKTGLVGKDQTRLHGERRSSNPTPGTVVMSRDIVTRCLGT
jgi:hypothetical protein